MLLRRRATDCRGGFLKIVRHVQAEQTVDIHVDLYPIKVSDRRGCGQMQNAAGGGCVAWQISLRRQWSMFMELILIIVVLVLLFGGGGYWGRGRGYW
jgi:hypothetical protein